MIKRTTTPRLLAAALLCLPGFVRADEPGERPLLPPIEPAPMVQVLVDDPLNSEQDKTDLLIFHGRWDALPAAAELTPNQRARLALLKDELENPALQDELADVLLRAEAALRRGEPETTIQLLQGAGTAQAALLASQAYEQLGQTARAVELLKPWRDKLRGDQFNDPAELTAAAEALVALARLEGRPAQDYQLALNLLGRVRQDLDPAYWPALIAEADLLIDKDNPSEGVDALTAALALNPVCSEVWDR
ncbi:MAG: hypothetical protein R3C45_15640, partial [Phycisphaerales bacterium]